jgi:hypothetical protein
MVRLLVAILWAAAARAHAEADDERAHGTFARRNNRAPRPPRRAPEPLHVGAGVQFKLRRSARVAGAADPKRSLRGSAASLVAAGPDAGDDPAAAEEARRLLAAVEAAARAVAHLTNGEPPTRVFRPAGTASPHRPR